MDKEIVVRARVAHTHTKEYYSAIKKNEILSSVATWMDLKSVKLSEKANLQRLCAV